MKKIIIVIMCVTMCCAPILCTGCSKSKFTPSVFSSVGSWWWDDELDSSYLDFAKDNHVTEIYYCSNKFNEETAEFITSANDLGMSVYWLAGDYKWLTSPQSLYDLLDVYENYQSTYPQSSFAGVHLDIEPHQNPEFENNRVGSITALITLASILNETYTNISFDYDIPFWLDDEITIRNEHGNISTLPAYAHMINIADRIVVMSYSDTASEIYNIAKEELEYSKSVNKNIILSVETSDVGDEVSFYEEGKKFMYNELTTLQESIQLGTGIAFQNIKSWKRLSK